MSNFKYMLTVSSKESIINSNIEYPCILLIAPDTKEAEEEWVDIIFDEEKKFWTNYLPSIILMTIGVAILVYEYFNSP